MGAEIEVKGQEKKVSQMDSQCVLTLDGLSKSTEVAVDGGKKPYWISNVIYPVKEGHPTLIKVSKIEMNKVIF